MGHGDDKFKEQGVYSAARFLLIEAYNQIQPKKILSSTMKSKRLEMT
ncbi:MULTISPECIES: hypothetical protein [Acinetobacter]|nr:MULTISPECIES: hypothetical protein [Acinetobacter]